MARAHQRWGRLPWPKLFEPAIRLAGEGFTVSASLNKALGRASASWGDFPEARALYWQEDKPKPLGATVRNPALAALLRTIADAGPDAFYTGESAAVIVRAVSQAPRNPATITAADLSAYHAKDRPAVCGRYRIYRICGMGPPSSGATTVLQILGMIERFDMAKLGRDDPRSWHLIAEAMLLAYADRDKYLADRDFVAVPVAGLIDPAYLAQRSKLISIDRWQSTGSRRADGGDFGRGLRHDPFRRGRRGGKCRVDDIDRRRSLRKPAHRQRHGAQ
jgi:gamma-glutamyltranspeptidase/glutathione hydrolase